MPRIFSLKRIGKLDAVSSRLNRKLPPIYKGCFTLSIRGEFMDTFEMQMYAASDGTAVIM